jgi:acetyltransferase-like isoleucine patch superfamily enzyme
MLYCVRSATTSSGTFSVALSDDNGVTATREVTVNATDMPAASNPGWVFFKFSSSLTLDGGTDYKIGIKASSVAQMTVYRDATAGNWARYLRLTSAASTPAAADVLFIVGDWTAAATVANRTITMNSTTNTNYGAIYIGSKGTLSYGTSAATNYVLTLAGTLTVGYDGTLNIGTSGTPIPRDSTAVLEFVCSTASQYGLDIFGTCNMYGQSRTSGKDVYYCKLSADRAAGGTSLTVDTDTGWLSGDQIALAPTSRTYTEYEDRTLNGNATSTTLTTNSNVSFAHSGTSPTQGEVVNLTRNVRFRATGSAAANSTYIRARSASTVNLYWAEFYYMGANTSGLFAFNVDNTSGAFNMYYCSVHDTFYRFSIPSASGSVITIRYNVFYKFGTADTGNGFSLAASSGVSTILNNIFIGNNTISTNGVVISDLGATFNDNTITGISGGTALSLSEFGQSGSFSNNTVHSCAGSSVNGAINIGGTYVTLDNFSVWRNANTGLSAVAITSLAISNSTFFGNNNQNINIGSVQIAELQNVTSYSEASFATTNGILINSISNTRIFNSSFSPAGKTAHSNDINVAGPVVGINALDTVFGAATEVANQSTLDATYGYVTSSKHDQTTGSFKTWKRGGVITRDTTFFNTASPSERLTPTSASTKLPSGPRLAAVDNGTTLTVSVYIRKSATGDGAAYNGNQPRLIVRRNDAVGITSDTVLATYSGGTGSWAQIGGTTASVTDDGALEFYVDCDGTAGWINVDDWSVS